MIKVIGNISDLTDINVGKKMFLKMYQKYILKKREEASNGGQKDRTCDT